MNWAEIGIYTGTLVIGYLLRHWNVQLPFLPTPTPSPTPAAPTVPVVPAPASHPILNELRTILQGVLAQSQPAQQPGQAAQSANTPTAPVSNLAVLHVPGLRTATINAGDSPSGNTSGS